MTGETTWWGAIDTFEGLRDGAQSALPVMLSDVTFAEPAAHGRGGFLLAKRESTSGISMIGGKVTLTDTQETFGTTGPANKLLMSSGTGDSLWALANTDLVVDTAALADTSRIAAFSGRLSAPKGRSFPATRRELRSRRGQALARSRASGSIVACVPQIRHVTAARATPVLPHRFDCAGR